MKRQGRGQQGVLLTGRWANIFYIRDSSGVLWAVHCGWGSDSCYWYVEANPVTYTDWWHDGSRVVSR
jgi:hypothetical protein